MSKYYTDEKNALIIIALLKMHGIRKIVASPGATNVTLVGSVQNDPYFEVYSSVDERSAAYIACGLAHESGEPVVISCTGATASRNYMPGLTEAYYRKLPVLAITSTQIVGKVGHLVAQVIDRSVQPNDTVRLSVALPVVKDHDDFWECEVKVNQAILELKRRGGGPAHINLPTLYSRAYENRTLPDCRAIFRFSSKDKLPTLSGKIAILVGAHRPFSDEETRIIDDFCASHDAVVFCDHTSSYKGRYRLLYSLAASQEMQSKASDRPDILIHIGEVTGDYSSLTMVGNEVWRVSEDGELRDTFRKLKYVFEMDESDFFASYTDVATVPAESYLKQCKDSIQELRNCMPEFPLSNIWLAARLAELIPENSVVHFGILNSLRSWNFFELPDSVTAASNVGGFGIDGGLSSVLGASLMDGEKLYFCIIGDLAFFYDMNSLGNRHIRRNLRVLLVNNGKGTEFRQYNHHAAHFGEEADKFISAAGHYGNKSRELVKSYAEALGFKYLVAADKEQFEDVYREFVSPAIGARPIIFEVFTDSDDESKALEMVRNIGSSPSTTAKNLARRVLGKRSVKMLKAVLGR